MVNHSSSPRRTKGPKGSLEIRSGRMTCSLGSLACLLRIDEFQARWHTRPVDRRVAQGGAAISHRRALARRTIRSIAGRVSYQPNSHAAGVPAARDQATEATARCSLGVSVKPLWVLPARVVLLRRPRCLQGHHGRLNSRKTSTLKICRMNVAPTKDLSGASKHVCTQSVQMLGRHSAAEC